MRPRCCHRLGNGAGEERSPKVRKIAASTSLWRGRGQPFKSRSKRRSRKGGRLGDRSGAGGEEHFGQVQWTRCRSPTGWSTRAHFRCHHWPQPGPSQRTAREVQGLQQRGHISVSDESSVRPWRREWGSSTEKESRGGSNGGSAGEECLAGVAGYGRCKFLRHVAETEGPGLG